jgi:AraC-like DNA-binding protein
MLLAGNSVTDTAFRCGFNDYANFIRTFKSAVGVSPGKYKAVSGL